MANEKWLGNLFRNDQKIFIMTALVSARDVNESNMDSTVPLWVVAFSTSQGEAPQVVKIRWHMVSPKYSVLK